MCSTAKLILVIILTLMLQSCHDFKKNAGLIIYNATIITFDSSENIFTSLALKDGRIVALGNDDEILSRSHLIISSMPKGWLFTRDSLTRIRISQDMLNFSGMPISIMPDPLMKF